MEEPQHRCPPRLPSVQSPALIQAWIQPSWPEDLGQGNSQLGTGRDWQCRSRPQVTSPYNRLSKDRQDRWVVSLGTQRTQL